MHALVQRLVLVVKMATVRDECTTEEQRYVVRSFFFFGEKKPLQRIFVKKCFLFTVGSRSKTLHKWVEKLS
jgi:hypothetical protein